ncbi:MAG: NTP transferase domain-containing protein [Elusimicrobia bacterium]|nr:NTP transferase domain-containing protein [Elusimicrobiota bacterium]MBD3411656.1 NTP transferase domain-containing protein [Elusimicrobiota bacterium]
MSNKKSSVDSVRIMMLAAGQGTRLKPLTYHIPKPLNPVCNKPVMEHTLEWLAKQGFSDIMINISYFPEMIQNYFGAGGSKGLRISYSYEEKALGTAGGVKKVENFFNNNTFIIVSGDGLIGVDLKKLLKYHRQKKSMATMLLKKMDMRYEYGVVLADRNGRIKKFLEKPMWSDFFSCTVNAGVYVFEPEIFEFIPAGKFYDFGNQVWPDLLKKKKNIYAYTGSGYWCDIGDLIMYRKSHWDAMDGKVPVILTSRQIRPKVWVGENTIIDKTAKITPPCLLGANCRIGPGVKLGPYVSIGDHAQINADSCLQHSVLWNNVTLANRVTVVDSIITNNVSVKSQNIYIKNAVITRGL